MNFNREINYGTLIYEPVREKTNNFGADQV